MFTLRVIQLKNDSSQVTCLWLYNGVPTIDFNLIATFFAFSCSGGELKEKGLCFVPRVYRKLVKLKKIQIM